MAHRVTHHKSKNKYETHWTASQTVRRNALAEQILQKKSIDEARKVVKEQLGLESYARSTAYLDYEELLKEWQNVRVTNVEERVGKELAEIDFTQKRLWERINERGGKRKKQTTIGTLQQGGSGTLKPTKGKQEAADDDTEIRYYHEIAELSKERRKLLGLYAPEKRELTNATTFASTMMAAAVAEMGQQANESKGDVAADGKPINWDDI